MQSQMTSLDHILLSAIAMLSSGLVGLWRYYTTRERDSAKLIFALLQRLAFERGVHPPSTKSTPTNVDAVEARALAMKELNGEIEALVKAFLNSDPPKKAKP